MKFYIDDLGEGPPIVLIHAFPLCREMWQSQALFLVNKGYRVILPDLPGFGENIIAPRHSIKGMAKQIVELLEYLKIDKAVIGGLSMGGYVTFELFGMVPEKFSGLILCDTTHLADTPEKRDARFKLIEKLQKTGAKALIDDMLPNLISDYTKLNNTALSARLEEIFSKVNPTSAANALQSMAERFDNSALIKKITVPTILVFGEFDKVTNLENASEMNQKIKDSRLVTVKNAGHYSNLEQPQQFNEALFNFCKGIKF